MLTFTLLSSLLLPLAVPVLSLTPPPSTYPNGTAQPFYPCGFTQQQVSDCPYRCLTPSNAALDDRCFTAKAASRAIAAGQNCVKCVNPTQPADLSPGGCQPLDPVAYFTSPTYRPSPCGVAGPEQQQLANCAWICGEAQVPFNVCSATDTSGTFSRCVRCTPQCSSPRVVFAPPRLPGNFSLSAGSCSEQYGVPETRWCPWRCTMAGDPNAFCAETDQSGAPNGFTSCTKCT